MTIIEQQLHNMTFNKLIKLPAYEFKSKYREEIKYMYKGFSNTTRNGYNRWQIFWLALKSFYNRYQNLCVLAIIIISLAIALFDKAITSQISIVRVFSFLVFVVSFVIHIAQFEVWCSYVQGYFSLINRKLKRINKKVSGFRNNRQRALDRRANEIIKEIIEEDKSNLDYTWKQSSLVNFVFALYISLAYVYIIGDSLNYQIISAANIIGFEDFDFIRNLTTQTIVFSLFPFEMLLSNFVIISSLKKRRECLEDSLTEVNKALIKRSLSAKARSLFFNQ